jgi:mRNA interferase RelE/StbE
LGEFRIEFSKDAFKTYKKLAASIKKRTDKVLLKLLKGDKIDLKPIKGTEDTFRIRIGSFRVLVKKITEDKVYLVFKIGSRGDIYQDL